MFLIERGQGTGNSPSRPVRWQNCLIARHPLWTHANARLKMSSWVVYSHMPAPHPRRRQHRPCSACRHPFFCLRRQLANSRNTFSLVPWHCLSVNVAFADQCFAPDSGWFVRRRTQEWPGENGKRLACLSVPESATFMRDRQRGTEKTRPGPSTGRQHIGLSSDDITEKFRSSDADNPGSHRKV